MAMFAVTIIVAAWLAVGTGIALLIGRAVSIADQQQALSQIR